MKSFKKVFIFLNKKAIPVFLASVLLVNLGVEGFAQAFNATQYPAEAFQNSWQYNTVKNLTMPQDNTVVAVPGPQVQQLKSQEAAAALKIQTAYEQRAAEERNKSSELKETYKYTEYDKTGYLENGKWAGKRKDGSERNTGFFGEIMIQGGAHRGKVITEASIVITKNGKEIEVPLLNPYTDRRDLEILRYGNVNERMIKNAGLWLDRCMRERRSPFALESEVAERSKWAYNDFQNRLQVPITEVLKKQELRKDIAARIKRGESNPYFFGEHYNEWKEVEEEVRKQESLERRAGEVAAANPLLTKADAVKQVQIADEEYEKNKARIEREALDSIYSKISQSQQMLQVRNMLHNAEVYKQMQRAPDLLKPSYRAQLVLPSSALVNKDISIGAAIEYGLISEEEVESIHQNTANKYIGDNINARFQKYIKLESSHNTANLGAWGSVKTRFNYFWTHIQNNSIIGKTSLWLFSGIEGLVTWNSPSKLYQRNYQSNQKYLDFYNIGTSWSFVDEIALTAGTFSSDAGVFKALGMASGAALPTLSEASSVAARAIVPSARVGMVLGSYEGINSFGNTLGYKNLGDFNSNDWGRIGYDSGRGFVSGAMVGQYSRIIPVGGLGRSLMPAPVSTAIGNGVRNIAYGMSEGAVFSLSGNAYDQANSLWLPAPGEAGYIGGNPNAFAEMTPEGLVKDMIKFYFAIKLPGNAIHNNNPGSRNNTNVKPTTPTRPSLREQAKSIAEKKGLDWAKADLASARRASAHKAEITRLAEPVNYDKNSDWLLLSSDGNHMVYRPASNRTGTLQPLQVSERAEAQNAKTFTTNIGGASGASGSGSAEAARTSVASASPARAEITLPRIEAANPVTPQARTAFDRLTSKVRLFTLPLVVSMTSVAVTAAPLAESAPMSIEARAQAQTFRNAPASTIQTATGKYLTTAQLYTKAAPLTPQNIASFNPGASRITFYVPPFVAVRNGWDISGGTGVGERAAGNLKGALTPYAQHQLTLYNLGAAEKPAWYNSQVRKGLTQVYEPVNTAGSSIDTSDSDPDYPEVIDKKDISGIEDALYRNLISAEQSSRHEYFNVVDKMFPTWESRLKYQLRAIPSMLPFVKAPAKTAELTQIYKKILIDNIWARLGKDTRISEETRLSYINLIEKAIEDGTVKVVPPSKDKSDTKPFLFDGAVQYITSTPSIGHEGSYLLRKSLEKYITRTTIEKNGISYEKTYINLADYMSMSMSEKEAFILKQHDSDVINAIDMFHATVGVEQKIYNKLIPILFKTKNNTQIYMMAKSTHDMKIDENHILVIDSHGNTYIGKKNNLSYFNRQLNEDATTTKEGVEYIHDRQIKVVMPEEGSTLFPSVFIEKVWSRTAALNMASMVMGLSSIGRFAKQSIGQDYGNVFADPSLAKGVTTFSGNIIYLMNGVTLLNMHKGRSRGQMMAIGIKYILAGLGIATIAQFTAVGTALGFGGLTLGLITAGTGIALLGQSTGPTSKAILNSRTSEKITTRVQVMKSLGSAVAYTAAGLSMALASGNWAWMFPLLIPFAASGLLLVNATDFNNPGVSEISPLFKPQLNTDGTVEVKNQQQDGLGKLLKNNPFLKAIFAGLAFFCGSEMIISTAGRDIVKEMLDVPPGVWEMASTFLITFVPVILGRLLVMDRQSKFAKENAKDDIARQNYNRLLLRAAAALAFIGASTVTSAYLLNGVIPTAVYYAMGTVGLVLAMAGLGNTFSLLFSEMDYYNNTKLNKKHKDAMGRLSTLALLACAVFPTIATLTLEPVFGIMGNIFFALAGVLTAAAFSAKALLNNIQDPSKVKKDQTAPDAEENKK